MTYPRANVRFTYYEPAPDDPDGRTAMAELMASDERWAISEGLTNIETTRLVCRDFSRPVVIEPPPVPWWHALRAGDSVQAARDGVPVLGPDRRQVSFNGRPMVRNKGAVMQLARAATEEDIAAGWLMVFANQSPFPGGLFVAAGDVLAAA